MKVVIDQPEPQMVLRLVSRGPAGVDEEISLMAQIAGSEEGQEILRIAVEGVPSQGDPLGQRKERIMVRTVKMRGDFPAKLDGHGHIEIGMKA